MNSQGGHPARVEDSPGGPVRSDATTPAPEESASTSEIQRQFTRYIRDPDNAPLPPGTDALRMRLYVRQFRSKLLRLLHSRAFGLVGALGEDTVLALLNDYVRLPRVSLTGASSFEGAFFHWLKEEWAVHGLPPWIPDLADYYLAAMLVDSPLEISGRDFAGEDDLLAGVPVFSELARLLRLEWPAHRIGKDFIPEAKPSEPTWLVVYRNRRGEGGYLELNRRAAEIAAQVRDNTAGRTGAEILADAGARNPFAEPAAALRDGLGILEALRRRDIILCARAPA